MVSKSYYYRELDEENDIYFFKVRALYKDKYSGWSNILSITNKKNILKYFKVKCKKCNKKVYFWDVFETPDFLIEKHLKTRCVGCKKKVWFQDIFKSTDFILDTFNIWCKECEKELNFNDIFKQNIFPINILNIKCKKCNKEKQKINFDALLE